MPELAILFVCGLALGLLFGFLFGKYNERSKWNDLIERGILPKPKNKQ